MTSKDNFHHSKNPSGSLFDLKFLNDFDNNALKVILLETFVQTVPSMCEDLQNSLVQLDYKSIKEIAHKLKPNIEMMGIASLYEAIKKVEFCCLKEIEHDLSINIQLIVNVLEQVIKEFRLLLRKDNH